MVVLDGNRRESCESPPRWRHPRPVGPQGIGGGSITAPITLPNTDLNRNYTLDGLGNQRATGFMPVGGSQSTDQRSHNYVNEITQRTLTGSNPVVFQYDGATGASNGNLKNDGTLIYAYDTLNRPIQINRVSDGLIIATYLYDAINRRVRKTVTNGGVTGNVPNGTTDYIWSGSQVVEERNSSNTPIRQYVWGTYPGAAALTRPLASTGFRQQNTGLGSLNIDECIQLTTLTILGPQNLPAAPYYLLQDLLYRAVALANSSGAIVEAYDTDAYGNTLIFTGPGADGVWFTDDDVQSNYGANEIIYCGYRYDPEGPGYYVRNRNYIPFLGRWLQRDPIGYGTGLNLYQFVMGNPASNIDFTGLATMQGTIAEFSVYAGFGFGGAVEYKYITKKCTCSGVTGEMKHPEITAKVHAGTGIGFTVGVLGYDVDLELLLGPQVGTAVTLALHNSTCGGPLNSGSEKVPFNFQAGLALSGGVSGFHLKAAGRAGAALDLVLEANSETVTFELTGEVDLKLAIDASLLWWTEEFLVPIPPGPGINRPGLIYEHSWPNPF